MKSVSDGLIGRVKKIVTTYDLNVEKAVRGLVSIWDEAKENRSSGKISAKEYEEIQQVIFENGGSLPIKAMRLITGGFLHRSQIKWISNNIHVASTLYSMSGVKLRSGVREIISNHLGENKKMNDRLVCCEVGSDIARWGIPYPYMTGTGITFVKIEDCTDDTTLLSIYRTLASDAVYIKCVRKTVKFGKDLTSIAEGIRLVGSDDECPRHILRSRIVKTGQMVKTDLSKILDMCREEGIIH